MSKPDFLHLPARLGVYTLTRHLGQRGETNLYRAKQSHVERGVIVEVLARGSSQEAVEQFLASVRARVAVHLPHVTQVYEAMASDDVWYLTLESPDGKSLTQLAEKQTDLSPVQVCSIIEAASKLYTSAEKMQVAAEGLLPHCIYLSGEKRVQFISPVSSAQPTEADTEKQMRTLAASLAPLLPKDGVPGKTRIHTLVDWMANGYEGERLDWAALADTAATISQQLEPMFTRNNVSGLNGKTRGAIVRETKRNRRKLRKQLIIAAIGAVSCLVAGIAGALCAPDAAPNLPANDGSTITCQRGNDVVKVAVRPVSIGEYREFLQHMEAFNKLSRDQRRSLLADIPQDGSGYRPDDWDEQWIAASDGLEYNGEKLSPNSPVRGVSYWNALVYARYHKAELPSARLLAAARQHGAAECSVYEWTTDTRPAQDIYSAATLVFPPQKDEPPIAEPNRASGNQKYGFRLVYP